VQVREVSVVFNNMSDCFTVLLQLLEQQENANGSTTLGPAETTHPPGPTIEIVENSTTKSSATTSAEIPSDNIVTAESNTFTESTIGPLPTISPIGDDASNVTSATTNQTTNDQTSLASPTNPGNYVF
jgi:hypothetical protein